MNTESVNEKTTLISDSSTEDVLYMINDEDALVPRIVRNLIPKISLLVDEAVKAVKNGGKIVYCGAGTSGRLAVADAAECPPTYGADPEMISAVIAGGIGAIVNASEGCEDSEKAAKDAFISKNIKKGDIVIGISASGNAPFVAAFMAEAKKAGCFVGAIVNNEGTKMAEIADLTIESLTGAEVIKGSTRMKAGTSQKLILNMFSTAFFIKSGYTYKNYMVNMVTSNTKLKKRAVTMVCEILGLDFEKSGQLLSENGWNVRRAINAYDKE